MIYSGISQNSARQPLCWEIRGDSVVNKLVNISFGVRFLSFGWHPLICFPVLTEAYCSPCFYQWRKILNFFPFPALCLFLILLRWTNKDTSLSHVLFYSTAKAFAVCCWSKRWHCPPFLYDTSTFLQEFQKVPSGKPSMMHLLSLPSPWPSG